MIGEVASAEPVVESRQRILDAALSLMSEHGVTGTSMRMLAGASDLNVATLYHYFPSKADLLRAVIAERGYLQRLRTDHPPAELRDDADPAVRLREFVAWLWREVLREETVWRLLIGESLRGNASARAEAMGLVDGIGVAIAGWVGEVVPELDERSEHVARLIRATLFNLIVEHLAVGPDDARAQARIHDLVDIVLPPS